MLNTSNPDKSVIRIEDMQGQCLALVDYLFVLLTRKLGGRNTSNVVPIPFFSPPGRHPHPSAGLLLLWPMNNGCKLKSGI